MMKYFTKKKLNKDDLLSTNKILFLIWFRINLYGIGWKSEYSKNKYWIKLIFTVKFFSLSEMLKNHFWLFMLKNYSIEEEYDKIYY